MATLKGIFPDAKPAKGKNFIHENVKNLRRKEQNSTKVSPIEDSEKSRKKTTNNNNNYTRDVLSKIGSNARQEDLRNKSSAPTLNKTKAICSKKKEPHKLTKKARDKIPSDPNISLISENSDEERKAGIKVKSQGIQTLDAKEIDELYSEGTIRYPSKKCLNGSNVNEKLANSTVSPCDRGDVENRKSSKLSPSKEETNFVRLNKEQSSCVATKSSTCGANNVLPASYRLGVIPKYIKARKEVREKVERSKTEDCDPNCPNGHVPLPEAERKETLRMLRKNYQDFVNELNMMPIKVDTLRAQRRKMEIERQLNKLEEGIKVFSRPKVYVKMNA